MKRILALVVLMLLGTAVQAEEADSKMLVGVSGTLSPAPHVTACADGLCHSVDWDVAGGATLTFDYNVWTYLAVGADVGYLRWSKGHAHLNEASILPHLKAFYAFKSIGLDAYTKLGLGYSRFQQDGDGQNAFALRWLIGVMYTIPGTGLAPFFDLGYHWATFKMSLDTGEGTTYREHLSPGAFIMNLGLAYRF